MSVRGNGRLSLRLPETMCEVGRRSEGDLYLRWSLTPYPRARKYTHQRHSFGGCAPEGPGHPRKQPSLGHFITAHVTCAPLPPWRFPCARVAVERPWATSRFVKGVTTHFVSPLFRGWDGGKGSSRASSPACDVEQEREREVCSREDLRQPVFLMERLATGGSKGRAHPIPSFTVSGK